MSREAHAVGGIGIRGGMARRGGEAGWPARCLAAPPACVEEGILGCETGSIA